MDDQKILCGNCGKANYWNRQNCDYCKIFIGFPNVNLSKTNNEQKNLNERYEFALAKIVENKTEAIGSRLESEIQSKAMAVKNVDLATLYSWVCVDDFELMPYGKAIRNEILKPKPPNADRTRNTIESIIYGSYNGDISYAALSLNGLGLQSYGSYSVSINSISMQNSASILEENSYNFIEKHNPSSRFPNIPAGYFANWENKHKLVIAKLFEELKPNMSASEFPALILKSDGIMKNDSFLEIHIWGNLNYNLIEQVVSLKKKSDFKMLSRRKNSDLIDLEMIKEKLGIKWKLES